MDETGYLDNHLAGLSVTARWCDIADKGTADCAMFCRCDDGSDYAVKDTSKHPSHPHSEYLCTKLGEMVGLASPPCRIVDVNGVLSFGSRWETGHEPNGWWTKAKAGEIDFALLAPTLSRILAFDLFVHNEDRHLTNYIVRPQRTGIALLAFDYSRAWLWHGFPPPDLPLPMCKTLGAHRYLRQEFGDFLSVDDVAHVLRNIRDVSAVRIESLILEQPREWLTEEQRDAILNWWQSDARLSRIDQIEGGIASGAFL